MWQCFFGGRGKGAVAFYKKRALTPLYTQPKFCKIKRKPYHTFLKTAICKSIKTTIGAIIAFTPYNIAYNNS